MNQKYTLHIQDHCVFCSHHVCLCNLTHPQFYVCWDTTDAVHTQFAGLGTVKNAYIRQGTCIHVNRRHTLIFLMQCTTSVAT